jgi:hypothetical protein
LQSLRIVLASMSIEYSISGRFSTECIESTSHGGSDLIVRILSCVGDLILFLLSISCFVPDESKFDGENGPEDKIFSTTTNIISLKR